MSHELYYTSAPRGLVTGSRGYCAVAMTKGLPNFLAERLEDLSGYKPLFGALDARNPVNFSHLRLELGRQAYHVLSRVAAAGLDYSERTNKFAHHVVLTPDELPAGGPAWLLQQPGFLETKWEGEPRWLAAGRKPPKGLAPARPCKAWEKACGDAGWAGVLAETAVATPPRPAILLYDAGLDVLALFAEALSLLPPKLRGSVTFSTYASSLSSAENCQWRALTKSSPDSKEAAAIPGALIITLGKPLGPAKGGGLVEAARTGKVPELMAPGPGTERLAAPAARTAPGAKPAAEASSSLAVAQASLAKRSDQSGFGESENASLLRSPWFMFGMGLLIALLVVFVGELMTQGALADLARSKSRASLLLEATDNAGEIAKLKAAVDKLAVDSAKLAGEKEKTLTDLMEARRSIDQHKTELGKREDRLAQLDKDLKSAQAERDSTKTSLDIKVKEYGELEKIRDALEKTRDGLQRELTYVTAELRSVDLNNPKDKVTVAGVSFESVHDLALEPRKNEEMTAWLDFKKDKAKPKDTIKDKPKEKQKEKYIEIVEGEERTPFLKVSPASGKKDLELTFELDKETDAKTADAALRLLEEQYVLAIMFHPAEKKGPHYLKLKFKMKK